MLYIGLMSGTSLDGIDAAIIDTNGVTISKFKETFYQPYSDEFRTELKSLILGEQCDWLLIEKELTELHAKAVKSLLDKAALKSQDIAAIGFHGQTIIHRPKEGLTWQMGNGALLSELTKINVVTDFRRKDVANGGQGAPLVPIFHQAIMKGEKLPCAVLNLGGVSNITYIGENEELIAFDCGPANAIINDACMKYFNLPFDDAGKLSSQGKANEAYITKWLEHSYFKQPAPKSLDRNEFKKLVSEIEASNEAPQNIIATLTKFAASTITYSVKNILPSQPLLIFVAGGGVKNNSFMKSIKDSLPESVNLINIKEKGLDPDFIEAQAFAFLAARVEKGLPISFPTTTGNRQALCGAALYRV
jgi:anhydro-N-acetylmuramic acid kinase